MENQKAPNFKLKNITGETVTLSSYDGKWLVLVFYRGNCCPKCNLQIADFEKDYEKFKALQSEIIAVSTDTPEEAKKTREKSQARFPILIDSDNEVVNLYGVATQKRELKDIPAILHGKKAGTYAMPAVFIIDTKGIIRYSYVGKSFTDRPNNEELLKKLSELQSQSTHNIS